MSSNKGSGMLPKHIAVIMDGNGRWAENRGEARHKGHRAGVDSVRAVVEQSVRRNIKVLSLFAFSSENWARPEKEVSLLMELFMFALNREAKRLNKNNVRLKIIGDRSALNSKLQKQISEVEILTENNTGLILQIAANYGGRWDITQSVQTIASKVQQEDISVEDIDEALITRHLSFFGTPDPDLFIRTGGEQRISNFILWQSAYAELYFSPLLWPDFREDALDLAINEYMNRERRFGKTSEQIRYES